MTARNQRQIVPSVLDRLISSEYDGKIGSARPDSLEEVLVAIARDLYVLLNTRRGELLIPEGFTEAETSILNFGLPDFVSYSLRSPSDQERLRRALETTIRTFEPRLSGVSVVLTGWDDATPVLRFQVEAVLKAGAEQVVFETSFRADSGKFSVLGERS
jgi:type VI secretion system protein ImpF